MADTKRRLGMVMDPIEGITPAKDSTLAMLLAAQRRGWELIYLRQQDLLIREGVPIGCMVTLRKNRMYDFLNKLINVALPRVRDFRGISGKAFDGAGNYSLGIKEQLIFPEIDYDKIDKIKGLNISIVTTAKNNEEGKELLKLMGMPFKN